MHTNSLYLRQLALHASVSSERQQEKGEGPRARERSWPRLEAVVLLPPPLTLSSSTAGAGPVKYQWHQRHLATDRKSVV